MSGNGFGTLFRFTTFGESHGAAIGCVIDGVPPKVPLAETDIQPDLDRRRPGQSRFTTARQEADQVKILSGVFEGMTTGAPIGLLIENTDQRSKDYSDIKDKYRPGHADYSWQEKYGIRDYRGGGRTSARETAMRVAAGAVAKKCLSHLLGSAFHLCGGVMQLGTEKLKTETPDWDAVAHSPFFAPDASVTESWAAYLDKLRAEGNSCGAIVEVQAHGIPVGFGAPVYDRLDADIAKALMSINAVKGVEIGNGFEAASLTGSENADEMCLDDHGAPKFLSNKAGGILGGVSSGQPIIARLAVKPTSSIHIPRKTIDKNGNETEIETHGRHDPCVGIRAVPVAEAMLSCVLLDHLLRHRGQCS